MQIIENKALLLRLRDPSHVLKTIPNSKPVGEHEVMVKWDVPEVHRLRSYNINVPSPIEGRYSWPGKYAPFEHQKVTAAFLTNHRRAFCFSTMGVGKTASAIWAADFLMERGLVKRALVICPVSIMDSTWRADLFNCAMHRTVDIAYGTADKRRKVIASGADFTIINFDGVGVVEKELHEAEFDLIIVDEASSYQNAQTKRWKSLARLVRKDTWLWMMTGTPAAQSPAHAYGLAKLVNPENTPRYFSTFRDSVMVKDGPFKWVPKRNAADTVHTLLQPAIRYTKEECLDLPDMVYTKRIVPLTAQQKLYYEKLRKEMVFEAAGQEVSAVNAAVKANKLLQIACIGAGTPVLCARGWVKIQDVTADDMVWDGEQWVCCDGAILKGYKPVIEVDGVAMTEDHLVLTKSGWAEAKECLDGTASKRFDRVEVRIPDCFEGGYGADLLEGVDSRPHRQQRAVQPGELSVGNDRAAGEQPQSQCLDRNPDGADDHCTSRKSIWDKNGHPSGPDQTVQMGRRARLGAAEVYDVLNCGPRNRFVVRGRNGQLLIVHNCGSAYTDDGSTLQFDIKPRYNVLREVIDETSHKVLVFAPFQNSIEQISAALTKDGITNEVINGAVKPGDRTKIFSDFQTKPDPRVLVIQPQAAAHGVTLTAADTIVWWGPTPSLEIYAQANARIHRAGQKNKCTVVQLAGSGVEHHIYRLLDNKIDVHTKLVDLYAQILD